MKMHDFVEAGFLFVCLFSDGPADELGPETFGVHLVMCYQMGFPIHHLTRNCIHHQEGTSVTAFGKRPGPQRTAKWHCCSCTVPVSSLHVHHH